MRVIFLDVDGVLANSQSIAAQKTQQDQPNHVDPTLIYDPLRKQRPLERRCVDQLARVFAMTAADGVVITSMWRHYPPKRTFLVDSLQAQGIAVLGDTPGGGGRGDEVKKWLSANTDGSIHTFVILDDQHANLFEKEGYGQNLVQTVLDDPQDHSREGLTREKADEAITIMGNQEFSHCIKHNKGKIGTRFFAETKLPRRASGIGVKFEI